MANASRALVAESGCKYVVQKIIHSHTNPHRNVSLARYELQTSGIPHHRSAVTQFSRAGEESFVLKPVSSAIWEQAQKLRHDLRSSRFVRLPVDTIKSEDESILVYEYFTEDLLSFVKSREILITQIKGILRDVLSGLKELHDNDWVHTGTSALSMYDGTMRSLIYTDIKSDNIVVEYRPQPNGELDISRVNLADPESAAKVKNGEHITGIQVGNIMWRSPEAQAGIGITKASDVFSFGIVVSAPIDLSLPAPLRPSFTERSTYSASMLC